MKLTCAYASACFNFKKCAAISAPALIFQMSSCPHMRHKVHRYRIPEAEPARSKSPAQDQTGPIAHLAVELPMNRRLVTTRRRHSKLAFDWRTIFEMK